MSSEKRRCGLCSKLLPKGSPFVNCASCTRRLEAGEKPADIMVGKKPAKDRRTRLHRALDCILDRKISKDDWSSNAASADHCMEQGQRLAEQKDWKNALWSYTKAKNFYKLAGMPKAAGEASRKIALCESKLKDV
jgi:hypothetical protein